MENKNVFINIIRKLKSFSPQIKIIIAISIPILSSLLEVILKILP